MSVPEATGSDRAAEARNLRLLAQCELGGHGNGGEGMGLLQRRGRRTIFVAHESAPVNWSAAGDVALSQAADSDLAPSHSLGRAGRCSTTGSRNAMGLAGLRSAQLTRCPGALGPRGEDWWSCV